ncbi:LytTR family transcriptional regulator DNA-binding domain-containing protein [Sphingomonas jaspsi]|uniref:LytTR family transcriptional regulator DNA-binding domain-containing protein n=1 Tax=Sphingomonas jaspsi TaxID=392409 RepID=UPI0004BB0E41|nr:LytTR family transcriptional regulator DNA-binding domain-containing protein [Sphingomonas jaspsi]
MVRTVMPSQLDVIVSFTFERQAKRSCLEDFKLMLMSLPQVRHCAELEGPSDFLIEAELPNLAAFHDFVINVIDPARRLISHFESNFVSRHVVCHEEESRQIWAQSAHGMRRVDLDRAQWLSAEGDYVRVCIDGEATLIHATLHSIAERLAGLPFVQIHRSTLVNTQSIRRLFSEGRRWFVQLADGSTHRIAKGRAGEINRLIGGPADAPRAISSNNGPSDRPVRPIDRKESASPPVL